MNCSVGVELLGCDRPCSRARLLDDRCLRLFDGWCERRAIVPLRYLMNAWPLACAFDSAICRIRESLDQLLSDDTAGLLDDERVAINRILKGGCDRDDESWLCPDLFFLRYRTVGR